MADQSWIDIGLVGINVQARASELAALERRDERLLLDQIAARGVDEAGPVLHQADPPRIDHVVCAGSRGAVQAEDVGFAHQIVESFDPASLKHSFDRLGQPLAVVIGDFETEGARAVCHGLAYTAHADDPQHLARQLGSEQRCRGPACPLAAPDQFDAFANSPRHPDDPRHCKVGRIIGEDTRRIGDEDVARGGGIEIEMLGTSTEIGDQTQIFASLRDHLGVYPVGYRGNQHVAILHRRDQLRAGQGGVALIETNVEQFAHPVFDRGHQVAGHEDTRGALQALGGADIGALHFVCSARTRAGAWSRIRRGSLPQGR